MSTSFTVGNPNGYERLLDEDPAPGKGVGGIAFATALEAAHCIGAPDPFGDGILPARWFPHAKGPLPARVYRVILPGSFDEATSDDPVAIQRAYCAWACEGHWTSGGTTFTAPNEQPEPEIPHSPLRCPHEPAQLEPGERRYIIAPPIERLLPRGLEVRDRGVCRSCQAPIVWVRPSDPRAGEGIQPYDLLTAVSHFATCPDAPAWRRKR